ncbi:2890_t:CDS:2, partial [Acaulospora colombiana]
VLRDGDTRGESVPVDTASVMDEDNRQRVLNEPALVFDGSFMKKRYQLEELEDRKFEKGHLFISHASLQLTTRPFSCRAYRPEVEIRNRALAAQDRYNKIESRENAQ